MSAPLRLVLARKWLLVLIWFINLVASYLVTSPWGAAIQASSLPRLPDAQSALFSNGGLVLIEWLRLDGAELAAALKSTLLLGATASLLQLFPTALLIAGLGDREKLSLARHGHHALVAMPRLVLVFGSVSFSRAILLVLLSLGYGYAASHASTVWEPRLALALFVLVVPLWWLPGFFEDLTRVFIVHQQLPSLVAVHQAWRCWLARKRALLGLAVAVSVGAFVLVCTGLALAWHSGDLGGGSVGLQFVVQQGCMLAMVALRAYFLGSLIQCVNSWQQEPDGTHADTDVPVDPTPDRGASCALPESSSGRL